MMISTRLVPLALTIAFALKSGETYSLREGELTEPTLVPLALEHPLAQGLAGVLLPEHRSVEERGRKLKIDTDCGSPDLGPPGTWFSV
jgi:hypothetical protein